MGCSSRFLDGLFRNIPADRACFRRFCRDVDSRACSERLGRRLGPFQFIDVASVPGVQPAYNREKLGCPTSQKLSIYWVFGGRGRDRTGDPLLANTET